MPKTVPKPKLQPNGRWKLRITVPSNLREMGFVDGKREIIGTHPPCTSRVAQSWAHREFLLFEAQVAISGVAGDTVHPGSTLSCSGDRT